MTGYVPDPVIPPVTPPVTPVAPTALVHEPGSYDITINGVGYMFDWNMQTPALCDRTAPEIQRYVTHIAQANAPYSARDTDPPYPLEFIDWRAGAGQVSLDNSDSQWNAYYDSRNIDPSQANSLSLGPASTLYVHDSTVGNAVGEVADHAVLCNGVWASFNMGAAGDQVRRLVDTDNWAAAAWSGTPTTQAVTAMCTDGQKVYAAFHDVGSSNGDIYCGSAAGSETADWDAFGAAPVQSVLDLEYSAGVLYAVQAAYTNGAASTVKVGWVAATGAYTAISGAAVIYPAVTTAGLTTVGNFVYWAVSGAGRSWVYLVQHSTTDTFELVAELPFTATSIHAHLGNVYVGGYIDTGTTYANDTTKTRYQGLVYVLANGTDPALLCNLGGDRDQQDTVRALDSFGNFLYILTDEAVYRYDLKTGGYHHYFDVPITTGTVTPGAISWSDDSWSGQDSLPDTLGWIVAKSSSSNGFSTQWLGDTLADSYYTLRVDSGHNYELYYQDDADISAGSTIEVMASDFSSQAGQFGISDGTVMALVKCGGPATITYYDYQDTISLASWDSTNSALLWTDTSSVHAASAGGEVWIPSSPKSHYLRFPAWHDIQMTLDPVNGAVLYHNGAQVAQVAYSALPPIDDSVVWKHSHRVHFSDGTPCDTSATDQDEEVISYQFVRWANDGVYAPGWVGGSYLTHPQSIVVNAGQVVVPLPGAYVAVADPSQIATTGWLQHSCTNVQVGTKLKQFSTVNLIHSALLDADQSITVTVDVDGVIATQTFTGPSSNLEDEIRVDANGRVIKTLVTLADAQADRPVGQRIHVSNVSQFFSPLPTGPNWTFTLNIGDKVQMRNKLEYDIDPVYAIANLYSCPPIVPIDCAYGVFSGTVISVKLTGVPTNLSTGDRSHGQVVCVIKQLM